MKLIYPPDNTKDIEGKSIFLAESIEMNEAIDWQQEVIDKLSVIKSEITIFNPRRKDWDSSWKQTADDTNFNEQVKWEQSHLDKADIIYLYFDPKTKSPISLLELGIYATSNKLIVCCPDGFYRKGNVELTCEKYNIKLFHSKEIAIDYLIFDIIK